MGNFNSVELICNDQPYELTADIEERNIPYTNCILNALEKRESAFFAPGAGHYIGKNGILSMLEQQGVKITQIELN